jgi:hypothetical protein
MMLLPGVQHLIRLQEADHSKKHQTTGLTQQSCGMQDFSTPSLFQFVFTSSPLHQKLFLI